MIEEVLQLRRFARPAVEEFCEVWGVAVSLLTNSESGSKTARASSGFDSFCNKDIIVKARSRRANGLEEVTSPTCRRTSRGVPDQGPTQAASRDPVLSAKSKETMTESPPTEPRQERASGGLSKIGLEISREGTEARPAIPGSASQIIVSTHVDSSVPWSLNWRQSRPCASDTVGRTQAPCIDQRRHGSMESREPRSKQSWNASSAAASKVSPNTSTDEVVQKGTCSIS